MNIMNLDKREITRLINEWNSSRYELFALSQPNDRLEFHGVMRFYFQDAGEKVSTKCIRVDSTATTEDVIEVLIEKFRPDMKSLSSPKDYAIYEVHSDAQERKLDSSERPLWIQLEWGKEGREGRFLLKNENCKTVQFDANADGLIRDKKRMSKRDKKKLLKQKEAQKENSKVNVAEHLYKEVPDSNFTRSISNPEIVMARRRQQKLENKLKQIKNRDGGGTLKVYGETLKPDIPYKTLLMSNQDTAAFAVKETLEKYGLTNEDPDNYCLVQVVTPSREEREKHGAQIKEYILEDTACPLAILMKHPSTGGSIIFQIRRCTPDILAIRKQKKKLESEKQQQQQQHQNKFNTINSQSSLAQNIGQNKSLETPEMTNQQKLPFLVELTYEGFDLPQPRIIQFKSDFYEIGNDKYLASTHPLNYIRIDPAIPGIEKKHCGIKKSSDNLQLLLIPYAETYVNDRLVKEHTQLFNGFTIRLGKYCLFRLENPNELNNVGAGNNKPVGAQQVQQTPVPANYGLLYDGQITESSVNQNRALSPIQNRMEPNRMSQNQINKLTPQQTTTTTVESGLPGLLQFSDENGEDALLAQICTSQNTNWQFKLAPVYTMYMMLRYRLSRKYKPDLTFNDKLNSLPYLIHKMVNYIREAVDLNHSDKYILPYWLSNSSELLYFLKQDIHLSQVSYDAQDALAECVQITFKYIVNIMQMQLDLVLASFFDPSDHIEEVNLVNDSDIFENDFKRPTLKHVIGVLNEAMSLLRGARVNAALTIQLFSQLFHYISIWLFNRLVSDQRSGLCSFYWGERLLRRLGKIKIWAEKQGLELAADCHLQKINHAAYFLQAPKHDAQFASNISSNCFSLNSFQIKCLIKNYVMGNQEPQLSPQLLNSLIITAQNTADVVIKQEGRQLQLDEDVELQLPFLLPQDGHSSEIIKGLPAGLLEFLESLQNMGHCWLWQNNQGPGSWKKFMIKHQNELNQASQQTPQPPPSQPVQNMYKSLPNTPIEQPQPIKNSHPKVIQIKLAKKNGGLGLSIVAAPGSNKMLGIYIKSVVPGGAAADDGRLNDGDQLLAVDDNSLINITQEKAAELMTKSGPVVLLTIAKDAAVYNSVEGLNDKPVSKSQQFNPTQSMPILNNSQNFQPLQQQSQQNFSAQTLPRNHHLHQQSEIQEQPNYRARSMSSEILDRNPQPKIIPQLNHQQPQVQRSLPNEQQIRYGSERPVMMDHRYQRNLPNEIGPRYGSERPASTLPQQQRNNFDTSPIKQFNQPIKQRQASLNELDEIDYNNQNENNFDDLYGKVNQNRQNEQYKTLPNRPNNLNINNGIEDSRTKSFGQLYEQIWSQNNNQIRQTPQHQFQQQQLVNRMNQVSLEEPKVSRSNLLFEQNRNGTMAQRNYENQMIQNQSRPPPPAVMAKPSIPAKNFNLNLQNHQNQKYQENHVEISIQQNFTAGTAKIINQKDQYLTREKADEEFRLNLLKQRIEMLNDLESKSYRTHEEENKLNKLRTEIEFDKRVIEMKSLSNYLDETADDNDTLEYAPEVRERFANEILQRRKQFQEENEMKLDRVLEAKREEQRLKRHVERNSNSNLQELNNQNFQELEIIHARSSTDLSELSSSRPQKHVQFMQEAEMISPKSSIGNNLKATSSSSSSDQLDSSPSTPPPLPAQPQPNHHPKRVMFSDIEFDRNEIKNDDIIHNTPSVIGANEVYVDQRLKAKLQQQQMQQQMIIEGEKLSFKDKMKLFAKQSGENLINDADNKLKVSRKQREIESKFVSTENK